MQASPEAPLISVIIPVYREEAVIAPFLQKLARSLPRPQSEYILVDGSPGRETLDAARGYELIALASQTGRAAQMNTGAAKSRGRILLFLHADTALPPNAFGAIQNALAAPDVAAGAFTLRIVAANPLVRAIGPLATLRSRLTRVPFGDQAIFIRREVFFQRGGFAPIPIMEDLEFMRRLRKAGDRIVLLDAAVSTSGRRWEREGLFACSGRNLLLQTLYTLGVSPFRLARLYPQAQKLSPPGK